MSNFQNYFSRLLPVVLAGAIAGCDRKEPRVYLSPKDLPPAPKQAEQNAEAAHAKAERAPVPKLNYTTPAGWKDLGGDGMNVARFDSGGAMLSVTPLPSFEGKETMPINLWRSALGQEPVDEETAAKSLVTVPIAGTSGKMFDLTGERGPEGGKKEPNRIVTAFVHHAGATWFFKMQGPPEIVGNQTQNFKDFIAAVRFDDTALSPNPAGTAPVVSTPPAAPTPPPATSASVETPSAPSPSPAPDAPKVPGNPPTAWTVLAPGPMQSAKFKVPEQGGANAEVTVSIFPSDTGGMVSNVRRWRSQLGMPEVDDATIQKDVKPLEGGPEGASLVTLENGGQSLTAAIVPRGGMWYFYKLMGGTAAVASAREAFIVFSKAQ